MKTETEKFNDRKIITDQIKRKIEKGIELSNTEKVFILETIKNKIHSNQYYICIYFEDIFCKKGMNLIEVKELFFSIFPNIFNDSNIDSVYWYEYQNDVLCFFSSGIRILDVEEKTRLRKLFLDKQISKLI